MKWYTEDKTIRNSLDDKIDECEALLQSDDQDEIDLFLFNFYKRELMQRYFYLASDPVVGLNKYMKDKFYELDPDYNTTFGLSAFP